MPKSNIIRFFLVIEVVIHLINNSPAITYLAFFSISMVA